MESDRAGGGDAGPQRSHPGLNHAQAKALRACRIDRDPGFALPLVGIFGDELHIHERRFSGLVEMLAGDHRVIPIEYFPARIGCWISCWISCLVIAEGGNPIARSPCGQSNGGSGRSEEHTSELQSLMRISYAVFCLIKKKTTHH